MYIMMIYMLSTYVENIYITYITAITGAEIKLSNGKRHPNLCLMSELRCVYIVRMLKKNVLPCNMAL